MNRLSGKAKTSATQQHAMKCGDQIQFAMRQGTKRSAVHACAFKASWDRDAGFVECEIWHSEDSAFGFSRGSSPALDAPGLENYFRAPDGGRSSMVESQLVELAVAGSSPVGHPIRSVVIHYYYVCFGH